MDIDFHYYATYVAARFAGYPAQDALTMAISAQMIDENARHVVKQDVDWFTYGIKGVPDDFELRHQANGPAVHTYRVQQTFQGLSDIGTSSRDTLSSIWTVYHFLPGNFSVTARKDFVSPRWARREYTGGTISDPGIRAKFGWLCRPHSPMAIRLVNNCRELVHDKMSVIHRHHLENYLIGVTMHVFVDTWAHQDFVGIATKSINSHDSAGIREDSSRLGGKKWGIRYRYINSNTIPDLQGDYTGLRDESLMTPWEESDWGTRAPKLQAHENGAFYVGHGQVGHLPDHSSLIWQYRPAWSSSTITRNNPIAYLDAFIHLVSAMRCIRLNIPYTPFEITSGNILQGCQILGISRGMLSEVYNLLTKRRSPWGDNEGRLAPKEISDAWDRAIYGHGATWREAIMHNTYKLQSPSSDTAPLIPEPWIPGQSAWVMNAARTLKENRKQKNARNGYWYTIDQFRNLDFFKFNVAAKFHYRFVKQQLLAFNQQLLGDWADGAAYSDDWDVIDSYKFQHQGRMGEIIKELGNIQRTNPRREINEGMTVLIDEIKGSSTEGACAILANLVFSVEYRADLGTPGWSYGILDEKGQLHGKETFNKLIELITVLPPGSASLADMTKVAITLYHQQARGLLTSQSKESTDAIRCLRDKFDPNKQDDSPEKIRADLPEIMSYLLGLTKQPVGNLKSPLKKPSRLHGLLENAYKNAR